MAEADLRAERLKKLEILKKAGMEAYPARVARTLSVLQFLEQFEALQSSKKEESIAGRVMSVREHGGIIFVDLFDGTGKVQIVLKKGEEQQGPTLESPGVKSDLAVLSDEQFDLFFEAVDQGDFVSATGAAFTTKRGEKSLQVGNWHMAAKSLLPMPDQWFGIKDEETRLRERAVSILLDEDLRAMVERRSRFWKAIRQFLDVRGFLEVETPILETMPGGADARPFITHHHALDIDVYLRIAPELWLKRLLIAGFPKIFEIGRNFRNEGQSREHAQDYTALETYEAYSSLEKGGDFVKDLYRHIAKEVYGKLTFDIGEHTVDLGVDWKPIDFCEIIKKEFTIDPLSVSEEDAIAAVHRAKIEVGEKLNKARAVDHLWKKLRKNISGPAFLVGVPVYLEPLAKRYDKNPDTVERLQVILGGSEMGKGFSELNDPQDQRARFQEQQRLRDQGDEEAQRLNEPYIRDMEYGMPPAFGFGVSERLFAFFENKPIHEVQLFPLLRKKGI